MAATSGQEPKRFISALEPFYEWARDISWLVVRVTVGGMLFVHSFQKVTTLTIAGFAANSLARRGIEPSVPAAYAVFFLETAGALCLVLGLFTRAFALAIGIEFLIITFVAHWPNGFGWTSPRGGWEHPLFWGLMILAISLRGGGPYSLDRKLRRKL